MQTRPDETRRRDRRPDPMERVSRENASENTSEETEARRPRRRPVSPPLPAIEAASAGLRHVAELTGREPEGVVSLEPTNGGWLVGVEVVEDRRIPSSTDILGLYEAQIDSKANLVAVSRSRRYSRGKDTSGEAQR